MTESTHVHLRVADDGAPALVIDGHTRRLSQTEFDAVATAVDAVRDASLLAPPPFERLAAALEAVVELAETKGDERQIWSLVIDRLAAVRDSGLLEKCGLGDTDLFGVVDEGYAEETRSMIWRVREVLEKLDPLVASSKAPGPRP